MERVKKLEFLLLFALAIVGCKETSELRSSTSTDEKKVVNERGWRSYYLEPLGLDSPDAPNELLFEWTRRNPVARKQIPRSNLLRIATHTSFDCSGFEIDREVKQAISDAEAVTWLRLGDNVQGDEILWVARLDRIRGLSLSNTSVSQIHLEAFGRMPNL
ncbi:MAG: hypothetical protein ACR2NU_06350, partial [Aeoliella sp.]